MRAGGREQQGKKEYDSTDQADASADAAPAAVRGVKGGWDVKGSLCAMALPFQVADALRAGL